MRNGTANGPRAAHRFLREVGAFAVALLLSSAFVSFAGAGSASASAFAVWAHDSLGATSPSTTRYLAEGCTAGDFETWPLVQNPADAPAEIGVELHAGEGLRRGPHDTVPPRPRRPYHLGRYAESFDLSAMVTSDQAVVCERAMYGRPVVCLDPGHAATPSEIDPETGLNTQDRINEPETVSSTTSP